MNGILKSDGTYIKTTFTGELGRYKVIGTRQNDNDKKWQAMYSVDTLKLLEASDNPPEGAPKPEPYSEIMRGKIFELAELGKIK